MQKITANHQVSLLVVSLIIGLLTLCLSGEASAEYKVGVWADRGKEQCLRQWKNTARVLSDKIPDESFVIVPLELHALHEAVRNKTVDFVLADPAIYVGLEMQYEIQRIATRKSLYAGKGYPLIGSLIITRSHRRDISELTDLRGKKIMAVDENSLGGWLAAYYELKKMRINPYKDFRQLLFGGNEDTVVYAVLNEEVDAGIVSTIVFERMVMEGKIDGRRFKPVGLRTAHLHEAAPYQHSTDLYPEWSFAKAAHTPRYLAEQVLGALLSIVPDSLAAYSGRYEGWTIPLNYEPVRDCLKELRVWPYVDYGKITLRDVFVSYKAWIITLGILLAALLVLLTRFFRISRILHKNQQMLEGDMIALEKTEETLQQQIRHIESVNKELDDFTYIVSHDLKEPLRSIDAFSRFLFEDYRSKLDEEAMNYLQRIRVNSSRMQRLIEDLLTVSRIERKKNPFEEADVQTLVAEAQQRLEFAIHQKNVQVTIATLLPKVWCDRVRIAEVFANLMSNAIKFADKNPPVLEIGCRENEKMFEFYVKDNGPGIEEKYFEKIFEIFQRLNRREDVEGTGAGLTIVKKIIGMHRGKIWVTSVVGEGATFHFTLPKDKDTMDAGKKIGEILVEKKLVSAADIISALREQRNERDAQVC